MKQNIKIYVVHRVISDILGGDGTLGACLLESSWGIAQVSKHPETQHSVFFFFRKLKVFIIDLQAGDCIREKRLIWKASSFFPSIPLFFLTSDTFVPSGLQALGSSPFSPMGPSACPQHTQPVDKKAPLGQKGTIGGPRRI